MAQADGHLIFDTEIDESGFNSGTKKLGAIGKKSLSVLAAGVAAVTAAMGAGLTMGVKYNASIEQYTTSFEVMTGSAEKAADVVSKLKKIGAETPFEMPQLADVTQLLMNYGFTADDALEKMQMLGDISQGSADKMSRIATAYGQMSSAGKVSLEDVKQMIEAGFNPLQEITQSTGESMASLYDRISKGTISVDEITAAMKRSTSEGGKYFNSMDKQSQTLNGRLSTLKDTVDNKLGEAFSKVSDILRDKVIPAAIETIEAIDFDKIIRTGKKLIPVITAIGTGFAAWKIKGIITPMIKGFQEAKLALNLYKLSTNGASVAQGVFTGAVTTSEAAVALLTGQMTLYEVASGLATKATALFHAVLGGNPIGAAIMLLAGLTAGILAVTGAFKDSSDPLAQYKEDLKGLSGEMDNYRNKMQQLAETRKNTIESGMGELNYYQQLGEELGRLADENGRVTEGYESRANFIITTLNEALGTEISMTDGVIQNYGTIADSIDSIIEKKKAELVLQAYEEEYVAAIKARGDAIEALAKQQEVTKQAEYEYQEALRTGSDVTIQNKLMALEAARAAEAQYAKDLGENTNIIDNYERMQADAIEGKTDAVIASAGKLKDTYVDMTTATREELEKQKNDITLKLNTIKKKYEETGAEIYKGEIESYQKQLKSLNENLNSMESAYHSVDWSASGGYVVDGVLYGMNSREFKLIDKAKNMALNMSASFNKWLDINSPSRVMLKSGKFAVMGVEEGIEKETPSLLKSVGSMARALTRGLDSGLDRSVGRTIQAAISQISAALQPQVLDVSYHTSKKAPQNEEDEGGKERHYVIEVPINLDNKQIAKGTVRFTDKELENRRLLAQRGVVTL